MCESGVAMEGASLQAEFEDVCWYVCATCHRAFVGESGFRFHKRSVQHSTTAVMMLSHSVDLSPIVRVERLTVKRVQPTLSRRSTKGQTLADPRSFACNLCPEPFRTTGQLKKHVLLRHAPIPAEVAHDPDGDTKPGDEIVKFPLTTALFSDLKHEDEYSIQEVNTKGAGDDVRFLDEKLNLRPRRAKKTSIADSDSESDPEYQQTQDERSESDSSSEGGEDSEEGESLKLDKKNRHCQCSVCLRQFSHSNLKAHVSTAHCTHLKRQKQGYPCDCVVCYKEAFLRATPITNTWECKLCQEWMEGGAIKTHVRRVHPEEKVPHPHSSTSGAESEWRAATALQSHEFEKEQPAPAATEGQRHECALCGRKYKDRRLLKRHMKSSHNPAINYTCSICNKTYPSSASLKQHKIRAHAEGRPHLCATCGLTFKTETDLKVHRRYHDPTNKTFICDNGACRKAFFTVSELNRHKFVHSERTVMCPECGKLFVAACRLKSHVKVAHSESRPYKCDKCDSTFKNMVGLRLHSATHSDLRPFTCSQCPKVFKTEPHLQNHLQWVHNDRATICHICNKKFAGKISLRRHELEVHDFRRSAKKYDCKLCDKKFPDLGKLLQHEKTHSDERQFKCDACGKAFKLYTHLRNHKFSHLPYEELPHVCGVEGCGKRFGVPAQLRSHKQRIHEKKKKSLN